MNNPPRLHVAVGVTSAADGRVLITQRHTHAHLGGLWEFPGGKLESGETAFQALQRELAEEVGIQVQTANPLIRIAHNYPERHVLLDVWRITAWNGKAQGLEGQAMQWARIDELENYTFPSANIPIITALQLPIFYAVLEASSPADAHARLRRMHDLQISLVQIRLKSLPATQQAQTAAAALDFCRRHGIQTLLNSDLTETVNPDLADGLHLTSRALQAASARPPACRWLAASCHNAEELAHAANIGADFAVLAPAMPTASHPGQPALGWPICATLLDAAKIPTYLMGGLNRDDLTTAHQAGAQGVAGISAFY
jgi:8-oxo-dGTP diphosphatase